MRYKHYLYVLIPKKRGQKPGMKRCKMWKRTILYVKIGKTRQKQVDINIVSKKQTNIMILIIWKLRIQNRKQPGTKTGSDNNIDNKNKETQNKWERRQ